MTQVLRVLALAVLLLGGCQKSTKKSPVAASVHSKTGDNVSSKTPTAGEPALKGEGAAQRGRQLLPNANIKAALKIARINVEQVSGAVTLHAMSKGGPPTKLDILVAEGHLKTSSLKDPWGQWLRLKVAKMKGHTHEVCSSGPDRRFDTSDDVCVAD